MEFKVGDLVEIKSWDEMVNEFKVDDDGDIVCDDEYFFVKDMQFLCGKRAHITYICNSCIKLDIDTGWWELSTDMIKKVEEPEPKYPNILEPDYGVEPIMFINRNGLQISDDFYDGLSYNTCVHSNGIYGCDLKLNDNEIEEEMNKSNEKKEVDKMKLVDLYENRAMKAISKFEEEEVERRYNELDVVKRYNEIVNTCEASLNELYDEEILNKTLTKNFANCYPIDISPSVICDIKHEVAEEYEYLGNELHEKMEEVKAQLETINEKDHDKIMEVLKSYKIVDAKGHLKEYKIDK